MANTLTFANQTLDDANLFGGISYIVDINAGDEFSIGNTASACVSFVTDTQVPLYSKDNTNGTFTWDQDEVTRGLFYITEVTKNGGMYSVTAYDAMYLTEKKISALNLALPASVWWAATKIAQYIGCTIEGTIINSSLTASELDEDMTIRELLGRVAEASGCSVRIDGSDQLCFMYYEDSEITVTASEYIEVEVADYTCAAIDNVTIINSEGEIQATAGSGTNSLFIGQNPFLETATSTNATNIYNAVKDFAYAPLTCSMFEDNGIEVGTIATFGDTPTLVMHIESGEDGVTVSSVGSDTRAEYNKDIMTTINETRAIAVDAQTVAGLASSAAAAASTAAGQAQSAASAASSAASAASSQASAAASAASAASTAAGNAQSSADAANNALKSVVQGATTVEKAVSVMQTAIEAIVDYDPQNDTVEEYFWHDANGAHVLGTSGDYRADIKSTGMDIIDTSTEDPVAEFGAGGVLLGMSGGMQLEQTATGTQFIDANGNYRAKISSDSTHPFDAHDLLYNLHIRTSANGIELVDSQAAGLYVNGANVKVTGDFYIQNTQMTDFVVAQGTSGIWTYRKWNSGLAECWGTYTASIAIQTAAAAYGGYRSGQLSIPTFPFTFTAAPCITATSANGGGHWVNNVGSTTTGGTFYLSIGQSSAAANRSIAFHVMGKWK